MEKVTGRSDDMIILRGVNVFPTQIEEQLMSIEGLAPHFQIELSKPGRMDEMRVLVEAAEGFSSAEGRLHSAAALAKKIKAAVGLSVAVDVACLLYTSPSPRDS